MIHKFRAWDEDHFVYSDDEPGNPPVDGESWFGFEKGVFKAWVSTTVVPGDMYEPPYPSSEELGSPIEQYTGLKDRDGVEDWIDDIVKTKVGPITYYRKIFQADSGAFCINLPVQYATGGEEGIMLITCEHENVGNVHQNPELLGD